MENYSKKKAQCAILLCVFILLIQPITMAGTSGSFGVGDINYSHKMEEKSLISVKVTSASQTQQIEINPAEKAQPTAPTFTEKTSAISSTPANSDAIFGMASSPSEPFAGKPKPLEKPEYANIQNSQNPEYIQKKDYNSSEFEIKSDLPEKALQPESIGKPSKSGTQAFTPSEFSVESSDNCSGANSDLWNYVYTEYIESSGDVDWFKGNVSGTDTAKVVMVPPYNRDYDFEIYDNCTGGVVKKCSSAGTGQIESCEARVTDDYFVKVYGFNNANSSSASYKITARLAGTCNIAMSPGTPTKSQYLCSENIEAQNTKVQNDGSTKLNYRYYNDLYTSGNNFYSEIASNDISALDPNYYSMWNSGQFSPPSSGGWPDSGNYTMRPYIIGWCNNNFTVDAKNTAINPNVSCTAGSIIGYNGSPSKQNYACDEQIVTNGHRFDNTSNTYTFNYTLFAELRDPNNNVVSSGNWPNKSLGPGQTVTYDGFGFPATSGGWPKEGTYTAKIWADGAFTDGRSTTATSYASPQPQVPNAPCRNEVTSRAYPEKNSFACTEELKSSHEISNKGTRDFSYTYHFDFYDPDGIRIGGTEPQTATTQPGLTLIHPVGSPTSNFGNWTKTGNYKHVMTAEGKFSNNEQKTITTTANLYVPNACSGDQINGIDGASDKDLFACDEQIYTTGHKFENTSKLYKFTYRFHYELTDPNGNVIDSGQNGDGDHTIDPGKNESWWVKVHAPNGGWPKPGTYTMKTWASGTLEGGRQKTAYSYAYPNVPNAPCQRCEIKSSEARVEQDGICNNPIITKHKFSNTGTRVYPHDAKFYMYDSSNNLISLASNSYSISPGYEVTWTVTWQTPNGGWQPGTYRAEAQLSGTCIGGGSSSASNSVNASIPSNCNSACGGTINVNVRDNSSSGISNAKVYLDGSYKNSTDFSGNTSVGISDQSCGKNHNIAVYCQNGTYCDTKSTSVGSNGGSSSLSFDCGICKQSQNISVSISSNDSYWLNEAVNLKITVNDGIGNPIDGASLSIYDPFTDTTVSRTTSNGSYTYSTGAFKAGSQTFNVTASKSGYNSASASKSVSISQQLATIYVSVATKDGSNLPGANIYLDDSFEGTTNAAGRKTLSVQVGRHKVQANCPTGEFCASTEGYFSDLRNLNYSCNCDIDSDGDGLTKSEEELIGSDPRDASSNLGTAALKDNASCLNLLTGHIGPFSGPQKQKLIENLKAMNYQKLVSVASNDRAAVQKALDGTGVSAASMKTSVLTLKEFFTQSKGAEAYESADGTVVVLSVRENGFFDLTNVGPNCKGFFIGLPNGAFGGIRDDIGAIVGIPGLAGQVLSGMWWAFWHPDELPNIAKNVGKGLRNAFGSLDEALKDVTFDILREGKKWNGYSTGTDSYSAFQFGFLDGYISGYLIEQIATLYVGVGEVVNFVRGIKIGGKAAELAEKAYLAFARIGEKFGGKTAKIMQDLHNVHGVKVFDFASETAQDFVAHSDRFFAKNEDFVNYWRSLGANAEQVAAKGERAAQKLTAEIGQEATDRAMSKMLNSEFGRKVLAEWGEESIEGLAKASDRGFLQVAERISVRYGDDIAEIVGKGIKMGVIEADDELMYRLADYTKAVRKAGFGDDPLELANEHKLVKLMKSSKVSTKVGGETINNAAILKKGSAADNWGFEHIIDKHFNDFKDVLGISGDNEIRSIIAEVINSGKVTKNMPGDKIEIEKIITRNGKIHNIRVVVSDRSGSVGSIQTAHPA